MAELDPQVVAGVVDYIKKEILATIPVQVDQLNSKTVEALRNKLHVLRYYCAQKGFDPDITDRLDTMLETSQGLWELLEENADAFNDLKGADKARWLDLAAALLIQYEEVTSGEESFRDFIIVSIANFIGWKSDTLWVDMAKDDHIAVPNAHIVRLRDELWQFIAESSKNGGELTLERAVEIGEKMNLLLRLITEDNIPAVGRVLLLSNIYTLLLRFNTSKILISLETNPERS